MLKLPLKLIVNMKNSMNDVELRQCLIEKLGILSPDNINLIWQFVDDLNHEQASKNLIIT
jgi:hypothetical protein